MIGIVVFMLVWIITGTVELDAFTENIEKCEDAENRVIAYILVILFAPCLFITAVVMEMLECLGIEVEEEEEE